MLFCSLFTLIQLQKNVIHTLLYYFPNICEHPQSPVFLLIFVCVVVGHLNQTGCSTPALFLSSPNKHMHTSINDWIYVHTYKYAHTHRNTDRPTDRQTDRLAHTHLHACTPTCTPTDTRTQTMPMAALTQSVSV